MTGPLSGAALLAFHERLLGSPGWPEGPAPVPAPAPWDAVATNHRCNTRLWREEDLARRTHVPDAHIVANKRAIDRFNQERNDAVERIDAILHAGLEPAMRGAARQHSETPGMMVDRLSILALKCRAMRLEGQRPDADAAHREGCRAKLVVLERQRTDLARCLDELLDDCAAGRAWFRLYRQFKMYNEAATNPALREG
jgi:hypothetical protein